MNIAAPMSLSAARRIQRAASGVRPGALLKLGVAMAALGLPAAAMAVDFGPFSLTGFAKAEITRVGDYCPDCQRDPNATKQFVWADEMVQGKPYGAGTTHVTLFQPYLGVKFDLPSGFKVSAMLSQRWRDGAPDFDGFLYEKNIAISHEDYGKLTVGATQARTWMFADYPYGGNLGLSDAWGSSGAGYGLLTRAVRYTSRVLDVAEGDLVLEATYDIGEKGWEKNKPTLWELWAQYRHGDLGIDAMFQDAKNGTPSAFSHGPFSSLFYNNSFDQQLGSSSQGIAMVMASYQVDSKIEISGGLRGNRWSGAYAKLLQSASVNPGGYDIWSNPFNVDWNQDLGGGVYKGYAATSVDLLLGLRYRFGKFIAYTGMVHLGAAATDNPMDRGARNAATLNTLGLEYNYDQWFRFYGTLGMINYAKTGLAPLSEPNNKTFTNIDSRLTTRSSWFTAGGVFTF